MNFVARGFFSVFLPPQLSVALACLGHRGEFCLCSCPSFSRKMLLLVTLLWDPHEGIACSLLTWSSISLRQALYTWALGMKVPSIPGHPYSGSETLLCICLWSWARVSCPSPSSSSSMLGMFSGAWAQENFLPLFQR